MNIGMAIETQKYIRKPVYVDAVRITATNFDEIAAWCQGEIQEEAAKGPGLFKKVIKIRVQNPKNPRQTRAYVGDWLLYTDTGYKVYTNKAFRTSFDLLPVVDPDIAGKTLAQAAEDARKAEQSPAIVPPPEYREIGPVTADPESINGGNTYQNKRVISVSEQEALTPEQIQVMV